MLLSTAVHTHVPYCDQFGKASDGMDMDIPISQHIGTPFTNYDTFSWQKGHRAHCNSETRIWQKVGLRVNETKAQKPTQRQFSKQPLRWRIAESVRHLTPTPVESRMLIQALKKSPRNTAIVRRQSLQQRWMKRWMKNLKRLTLRL